MALTEAERKLLDELEATLTQTDPKLVDKFTQAPAPHRPARGIVGVLGVLAGLVGLVVGMSLGWWISVIGFVVMLGSVFLIVATWTRRPGQAPARPTAVRTGEDFLTRMERRWRDAQDQ